MALASINFCLLCIYALSPRFAVIKCICFGMDQWITLAHHHLHHILLSIYTSPLFLLCKLSLVSPFPPRSLIFPISLPTFLFFLAPKVFEPAYHAKHYCFSENKISSLNGQRAFSALLTKSRDLNKQGQSAFFSLTISHTTCEKSPYLYLEIPSPLNSN